MITQALLSASLLKFNMQIILNMKTGAILIVAALLLYQNLYSQDLDTFTGVYFVEEICTYVPDYLPTSDTIYFSSDTAFNELKVSLATNDTIDLELDIKVFRGGTLGLKMINDSIFRVADHIFNIDSNYNQELFVGGDGIFSNDSIYLNLGIGSLSPIYTAGCNSSGKKIRDIEVNINEVELQSYAIKLFPNPVKNRLQTLLPNGFYKYYIYNTYGQLIKESKNGLHQSIDVSKLSAGAYLIRFLKDAQNFSSGRFVKME